MNFGSKIGPLVAELLSGFTALLLMYFELHGLDLTALKELQGARIAVFILLAWLMGTFFDVIRNLLEHVWDHKRLVKEPLNWEFFFKGEDGKLANLEHYFYSFYMLDADMAIALILFLIFGRFTISVLIGPPHAYTVAIRLFLVVLAGVFALDAVLLRHEIKTYLYEENLR